MYNYQIEKPKIFTEQGQVEFIKVRDNVNELLDKAGAVGMFAAIEPISGDSWTQISYVDRLVELGEIKEVTAGQNVAGQDRVFVRA